MSLQRGENVKGWSGVTRDLAAYGEERHAWTLTNLWVLVIGFGVGVMGMLLSRTDFPTAGKALLIALIIFLILLALRGLYANMIKRAQENGRKQNAAADTATATSASPAKAPEPVVAREAAPEPEPVVEATPEPAPAPQPVAEVVAEPAPEPEPVVTDAAEDADADRPEALEAARDGGEGDDLTLIKGIGPALKKLCNTLGFWHFDQIAGWTDAEIAWVDQNLEGFKGRVTRDDWVAQAKILAAGGETEFSARQ